jgi:ATP-dependent protease ClpP protease subunit
MTIEVVDFCPLVVIGNQKINNFPGSCYLRCMTRAASFAGMILAAGESSRMGRDKALLPWPPPSGRPSAFE